MAAREVSIFQLSVPPVFRALSSPGNLTLYVAGLTLNFGIATPQTALPVPVNYGQVLQLTIEILVGAMVIFTAGAAVAALLLHRVRHVSSMMKPASVLGVGFMGYGLWALFDARQFIFDLGKTSIAAFYVPVFFVGVVVWMGVLQSFHTRAIFRSVCFPLGRLTDGRPSWRERRFRVYDGRDGPEFISERGFDVWRRLLGLRWRFNPHKLTPIPVEVADPDFESPRYDTKFRYFAWPDAEGEDSAIVDTPPRVWWLPWRKSVKEARAKRAAKLGLDPDDLSRGNWLVAADQGDRSVAAVGHMDAMFLEAWPTGTVALGDVGRELGRTRVALFATETSVETLAQQRSRMIIGAQAIADQLPGDDLAPDAMAEVSARFTSRIGSADRVRDLLLRKRAARASAAAPPLTKALPRPIIDVEAEATEGRDPWLRRKRPA
jgi:hypothetical protein